MPTTRTRMVRTQIQLKSDQLRRLRRAAAERGSSVSELVRHAVDLLLRSGDGQDADVRRRRALEAVGRFASGQRDISGKHDEYLEDAYRPKS